MAIDFTLSPEQLQLQSSARAFAEGVLAPIAMQLDAIADPSEAFYATRVAFRDMTKAGFTKSFIPVVNGGLGFGLVDFAIAAEELAHVDVNVPTTLMGSGLGLQPVIQFGDADQRTRFLQPFVDDEDGRCSLPLPLPMLQAVPTSTPMMLQRGFRPSHAAKGTNGLSLATNITPPMG